MRFTQMFFLQISHQSYIFKKTIISELFNQSLSYFLHMLRGILCRHSAI